MQISSTLLLGALATLLLANVVLLVEAHSVAVAEVKVPELRRTQSLDSINDRLNPAKANKISALLHFFHRKSKESVLASQEVPVQDIADEMKKYQNKTDREILIMFCPVTMNFICIKAIDHSLKTRPADMAEIANSIRNKPPEIDGSRLVYHKILETIIRTAEQKGYDEKLNKLLDVAVSKNPYLSTANRGLDLAIRYGPKRR